MNWILFSIAAALLLIHSANPNTIPGIIDNAQRAITSPQAAVAVSQDTLSNEVELPLWLMLVLIIAVAL